MADGKAFVVDLALGEDPRGLRRSQKITVTLTAGAGTSLLDCPQIKDVMCGSVSHPRR
jgi:hypothetical protein